MAPRSLSPSRLAIATTGVSVYGCSPEEATLFRRLAPRHGILPTITEAPLGEANVDLALGNRCVSVDHRTRVAHPVLLALSRVGVEYISTRSIGYDHIDVDHARSLGITVENVVYSPDGVADYTLMLMLALVRDARSVLRTIAPDNRPGTVPRKELRDLTVGVVGTGRIGTAVIDRLRAFGCHILAHDRLPKTDAEYVPLDDLVRRSDVVTLHTPLTAATRHLLDRRRIALLQPGAFVVNTGRGALLDTGALVCALESGHLGGAALDVLEGEDELFSGDRHDAPPEGAWLDRLHRLPTVLLSPHVAYRTDHALTEIVEGGLTRCGDFERGRRA